MTYCTKCSNAGRYWSVIDRGWKVCGCPASTRYSREKQEAYVSLADIMREYGADEQQSR